MAVPPISFVGNGSARPRTATREPGVRAAPAAAEIASIRFAAWGLAFLGAALAPCAARGQQEVPQYVGSDACQGCHPRISRDFTGNPHFKSVALADQPPERTGCEGCHGPASLHIFTADRERIVRFPLLTPSETQTRCLGCHAGDLGKLHVQRSAHLTGEVGCASCHSVHTPHDAGPLLADRERDLCYGCHQEIRARFEMPFKHRVNEGAMTCTDCHNPHGAPVATWRTAHAPRMVSQAFGNDLPCLQCHTDKRGPFLHEHAPVRVEGCSSCHDPHGSPNARLLNRPTGFLVCLECHVDLAGFGRSGDRIAGPGRAFHNLADPAFQECVLCHARIHGSNADPLFRR